MIRKIAQKVTNKKKFKKVENKIGELCLKIQLFNKVKMYWFRVNH